MQTQLAGWLTWLILLCWLVFYFTLDAKAWRQVRKTKIFLVIDDFKSCYLHDAHVQSLILSHLIKHFHLRIFHFLQIRNWFSLYDRVCWLKIQTDLCNEFQQCRIIIWYFWCVIFFVLQQKRLRIHGNWLHYFDNLFNFLFLFSRNSCLFN